MLLVKSAVMRTIVSRSSEGQNSGTVRQLAFEVRIDNFTDLELLLLFLNFLQGLEGRLVIHGLIYRLYRRLDRRLLCGLCWHGHGRTIGEPVLGHVELLEVLEGSIGVERVRENLALTETLQQLDIVFFERFRDAVVEVLDRGQALLNLLYLHLASLLLFLVDLGDVGLQRLLSLDQHISDRIVEH